MTSAYKPEMLIVLAVLLPILTGVAIATSTHGSYRMLGECARVCRDRNDVREWNFVSAHCQCNDWSVWYIEPRAKRIVAP